MMVAWNLQLGSRRLVQRARPVVATRCRTRPATSFSGHAANAAAVATIVTLLVWPVLSPRPARGARLRGRLRSSRSLTGSSSGCISPPTSSRDSSSARPRHRLLHRLPRLEPGHRRTPPPPEGTAGPEPHELHPLPPKKATTMSVDLHRWQRDESRPSVREAWRDAAARVLAPSLVLFAVIVSVGWLIMGPLAGLEGETAVNRDLQEGRSAPRSGTRRRTSGRASATPRSSSAPASSSASSSCGGRGGGGMPSSRDRHLHPGDALRHRGGIVGRSDPMSRSWTRHRRRRDTRAGTSARRRPLPDLRLHGAADPADLAAPARHLVCVLVPLLVSYARLYRGMYHLTDVLLGIVNGVVCALLAWHWLRRGATEEPSGCEPSSRARTSRSRRR